MQVNDVFKKCEINGSICLLVFFKNVIIQAKFSYAEQFLTSELVMS